MPLSRRDRFRLKTAIVGELRSQDLGWTWGRQNMLLGEFNLGPLEGDDDAPTFDDLIAGLNDSDLMEMYSIVMNVDEEDVQDVVESADSGNWKPGYVRLFISHSARHKKFVGEVADELAVVGIHGFVAHDTMASSKPWQAQIEQALRSCTRLWPSCIRSSTTARDAIRKLAGRSGGECRATSSAWPSIPSVAAC